MNRPHLDGQCPDASERLDSYTGPRVGANLFRAARSDIWTALAALWTLAMLVLALMVGTP